MFEFLTRLVVMDRRPANSPASGDTVALRVADARRAYQAVLAAWTSDLLLLRARGMLTPGTHTSPVRPPLRVVSSFAASKGRASRTTHAPSLRHAA